MIQYPDLPDRMKKLTRDRRGYPIPWFVAVMANGSQDFRIADSRKRVQAVNKNLCWVCGEKLGVYKAFVIGPMCLVNRVTAEPPCHFECAEFSAKRCPFLSHPRRGRDEENLPVDGEIPGIGIMRNPGVTCVYITKDYRPFRASGNSPDNWLIQLGTPHNVLWYAEGKMANRAQVTASIDSGYPLLMAEAKKEGEEAIAALQQCLQRALPYLPAA